MKNLVNRALVAKKNFDLIINHSVGECAVLTIGVGQMWG